MMRKFNDRLAVGWRRIVTDDHALLRDLALLARDFWEAASTRSASHSRESKIEALDDAEPP